MEATSGSWNLCFKSRRLTASRHGWDIFGSSGRAMMAALIAGERNPRTLAQLARSSVRRKITALEGHSPGTSPITMSSLLGRMLARVGAINTDTAELDAGVGEMIAPFTQPRSGWMRSPLAGIRQLRDHTRLRVDLTRDRSQHAQRLENALIKLSTVATDIIGVSGRAIIEALIAGQRDPHALAGLARGRMKVKYAVLVQALTGRLDDHHGWPGCYWTPTTRRPARSASRPAGSRS
jgi:hypothetical protein